MRTASRTVRHASASSAWPAVPAALQIPRLITSSEPTARAFYEAALAAVMKVSWRSRWMRLRSRQSGRELAQDQACAHSRSGGVGCRVGTAAHASFQICISCLEPATGEYVMLGKTSKASRMRCSNADEELLARETHRDQWTCTAARAGCEIAFSDLQASTLSGGLALRLARVKRYRDDKRAEDAIPWKVCAESMRLSRARDCPPGWVARRIRRARRISQLVLDRAVYLGEIFAAISRSTSS